ncbi:MULTISPECIES: DUF5076 domain-containing protein [unclassified Brevundimonas]|uniref:DUF5076 domain-containing protein n=1 Tax=unclassified Brevundimonas TaxID=2622653 RepID=UPI000CFC1ACC|nr:MULTISPECIES: DUF5076 domain-containing protein [unclassified Brevundimonas]PRA23066.1 hypothetical protein CQ024_15360 [Brevundimonas sp. MYb27]PQZ76849.1 hypothetical protein CQ026_13805 [Brevundimonas sp. MYb31]PRB18020.1 hypothetical protein CQ039_03140 [Brevundimonas sp. MYb52]PRB35999.1 hypothetical protein CQ035_06915 [Brevundimonas sp. MYb46]PRB49352.1 hypothetical protein CQ028_08645 [Brevundimonas sp. MYb33]
MDAAALEQRSLPVPEGLDAPEEQVIELARVWWNGTGPIMNLRPALAEPGNMGVVLAEMAWLYSHAYAEHHGLDRAVAFKAICDSWDKSHAQVAQAAEAETAK